MTTITLDNVTKKYIRPDEGIRINAVDNVYLKIHPGEVLVILGPSGCGKTTLLKMIAGLIKPDTGHVLYDNISLNEVPRIDRRIGMVFQDDALIPHWDNRSNIGFFLKLRDREDELDERLKRISAITGFGIDQLLDRRPGNLSGGEKQRVAVARALARDLNVLLCDEPFSNLDAALRSQARIELKRLLNEFPVTAVYVTHDQVEATALGTRIAVMRKGQIEQTGTYHQLYNTPRNLFVATFIGTPTINLFPGHVRGGMWWGHNFGGTPIRSDLPDGTPVTLGVRPEYIQRIPYKDLGDGPRSPAVVDNITPLFPERLNMLNVHLGGENWTLLTGMEQPVETGATIQCELIDGGLLYFDTVSGLRIG